MRSELSAEGGDAMASAVRPLARHRSAVLARRSARPGVREARVYPRKLVQGCVHRMLMHVLEAEVEDYLATNGDHDTGRAAIVRNGKSRGRTVTIGAIEILVESPRVHDRRSGKRFVSKVLPPYRRRSPKLDELWRVVQRPGLSRAALVDALSIFLGAVTLSAASTFRLGTMWEIAYEELEDAVRGQLVGLPRFD
jgi:hypothetical protein